MKKLLYLIILFTSISGVSFAQQPDQADQLIDEGIKLNDAGKYDDAIRKYDAALKVDKDNLRANAEKAYTYLSEKKYYAAIEACKKAIETHPGDKGLQMVYVTYGNCLDEQKRPEQSIEIYDQGIKAFPDFYMLYFNKAITLSTEKKYDEAIQNLETSVKLNPDHPGSQNALARLLDVQGKHVQSLMAFCRFFALEQTSDRASSNLDLLKNIMNGSGSVKKTGRNSVTINLDANSLKDTDQSKKIENNFSSTEMILTLSAAIQGDMVDDHGKKVKMNDVEKFAFKLESVFGSLKDGQKDNYGFYWEYYAPYFVEMKDKGYVTTFAYIANASSKDHYIQKWIKQHPDEIKDFFNWSGAYDWKKK